MGRISDVLAPGERFPLIIADPPWVRRAETRRFPEDPLLAIDGGDDGMSVVRECLAAIAAHLAPAGSPCSSSDRATRWQAVADLLAGTHAGRRRDVASSANAASCCASTTGA